MKNFILSISLASIAITTPSYAQSVWNEGIYEGTVYRPVPQTPKGPIRRVDENGVDREITQDINCSDLLLYTGRESRIFWSREISDRYFSSRNSTSSDLWGAYAGAVGEWNFDNDRSAIEIQRWQSEYFRQLDTVYKPALVAFNECAKSKTMGMTFAPEQIIDREGVNLRVITPFGASIRLQTVSVYKGPLACRLNGDNVVDLGRPKRLRPGRLYNIECTKQDGYKGDAQVRVVFSNSAYDVYVPESKLSEERYGGADDTVYSFGGCNSQITIAAAPYDRIARIRNVQMYGVWANSESRGEINIFHNGIRKTATGNKPANASPRGALQAQPFDVTIPAFTPYALVMQGGITAGQCENGKTTAEIVVPQKEGERGQAASGWS